VSKWGFQVRASFGKIDTQNLCVCEREETEREKGRKGKREWEKDNQRWCEAEVRMREIGKEIKQYERI